MEDQDQKESTIIIKKNVRDRLKRTGYKGETYNEIIAKLLDSKGDKIDSHEFRAESESSKS
jgi:hypothetical protein